MTEYTCPFEVGDKVRVLGAPKADKDYSPGWNDSMDHYLDKICTVRSVQQQRDGRDEFCYYIKLEECRWAWKDTWLAPAQYTLF